jgi:dTMP kinase
VKIRKQFECFIFLSDKVPKVEPLYFNVDGSINATLPMQTRPHLGNVDLDRLVDSANHAESGHLYVFEGPDDVGKTTLAAMLSAHLSSNGLLNQVLSFPGQESETVSELIYRLYHDPRALGVKRILPITMQVMVTAAHIEVVEARIKPLLQAGVTVILDRFWWSTWVYATQEGVPSKSRDLLIELELESWQAIKPDVLFLVMRRGPLLTQSDVQRWSEVAQLYNQLSNEQSALAPIQLVMNERTQSDAFDTIISRIAMTPGDATPR